MTKQEFLKELETNLKGLPKEDINERLAFYSEMIDDIMDEGKSEEDAVSEIGSIEDVVSDIAKDIPLSTLVKHKIKNKRKKSGLEITLLILGFPLWFPLLLTGFILLFVAYLLLWIMDLVLWVVDLSLGLSAVIGLVLFFIDSFNPFYIAVMLLGIGLSIFLFYIAKAFTKLSAIIMKKSLIGIKSWFIRGNKNE